MNYYLKSETTYMVSLQIEEIFSNKGSNYLSLNYVLEDITIFKETDDILIFDKKIWILFKESI